MNRSEIALLKGPNSVNTDLMSSEELRSFLQKGLYDINNSKTIPAKGFFALFRKTHEND
ncbi:hypothetical protein [Anaerovibrio sp.]|uniref:hypothetical protein n=1 Tax=Anaerovibrio sp. TaxID=1872532 RepID=UPI00388CF3C5